MNNISKYFDKSSKKRDLSGDSNQKKKEKRWEGGSKTNTTDDSVDDVVL